MWESDHKEGWAPKNWCFWTMVLEKTLESPLHYKEIKPVNLKRNQPWTFIRRIDAEAEAPISWPPDAKSWLTGKDPRKYWGQKEKGAAKDEMVRYHYQLNRHEYDQTLWDSEGQVTQAHCHPWECRVRHNLAAEQQQIFHCILYLLSLSIFQWTFTLPPWSDYYE